MAELVGYWAVREVLLADMDFKKEKVVKVAQEIEEKEGMLD